MAKGYFFVLFSLLISSVGSIRHQFALVFAPQFAPGFALGLDIFLAFVFADSFSFGLHYSVCAGIRHSVCAGSNVLSFKLKRGTSTAIVGSKGSGRKTTIGRLLLRLKV